MSEQTALALGDEERDARGWRDLPPGHRTSPVWGAVEDALDEDPDTAASELYRIARLHDPRVSELTTRQFYARVPLQILKERGHR